MEAENSKRTTDIDDFIKNPSSFKLFRGENLANAGGIYFTLDESWAKKFGDNTISGYLPEDVKVKRLTTQDLDAAFKQGLALEKEVVASFFQKGYDALIVLDSRDDIMNVIVSPKHFSLFRK